MWRYNEKLFGGTCLMNAESVKARLKNIAVKDGGTMQDKLIADRAYRWFMLGDYSIKGEENEKFED